MTINFLDRPVWNALSGRQADVAIGGDHARRFDPTINILAGVRDDSSLSLNELTGLVPAEGTLILLQAGESPSLPPEVVDHVDCGVQMVADRLIDPPADAQPVSLDENDAAAMLDLASLTEPGPFLRRTHVLGPFVGIKVGGQLVAMAGERLRLRGYSEVSGVCTHPDFSRPRFCKNPLSIRSGSHSGARRKAFPSFLCRERSRDPTIPLPRVQAPRSNVGDGAEENLSKHCVTRGTAVEAGHDILGKARTRHV